MDPAPNPEIHLAHSDGAPVTPSSSSAERMRRKRHRDKMYEREDWALFLDPATLGQKAGCEEKDLRRIVLQELSDNALDSGAANVHLFREGDVWVISGQRIELNMMTAPEFVAFVERKLTKHGVRKLVPKDDVLMAHARRVTEQILAQKVIDEAMGEIQRQTSLKAFPADLSERIDAILKQSPELSWDMALAQIIREGT
jgi:hypothetical protein